MEWPRVLGNSKTGVTSIKTAMEHTEICFGKDEARRKAIRLVQSDRRKKQGIVSVSDGLLPMMANLEHRGVFQGIDIDPQMCVSINSHRARPQKPEGNVPGVIIRPALNMTWNQAIRVMCERGDIRDHGLLDPDLTANVQKLFHQDTLLQSFQDLADVRWKGWIVVTGCVRADGFRNAAERECFIRSRLPRGIHFVKCEPYSSNYYSRLREYRRRPPMCQFFLQAAPIHGTNAAMRRAA